MFLFGNGRKQLFCKRKLFSTFEKEKKNCCYTCEVETLLRETKANVCNNKANGNFSLNLHPIHKTIPNCGTKASRLMTSPSVESPVSFKM